MKSIKIWDTTQCSRRNKEGRSIIEKKALTDFKLDE